MNTHQVPQTIYEETEALDRLTKLGTAEQWELEQAGVKQRFPAGHDAWGKKCYVIIDNNDRHWDYIPEQRNYVLSDNLDSPYLERL